MGLTYKILEPCEYPEWDAFTDTAPGGSVFHTSRWLSRVGLGLAIHVLRNDAGEIEAGVALVLNRKRGISGYHVPPYTPRFGPLVRSSRKKQLGSIQSEEQELLADLLDRLPSVGHIDFVLAAGHQDVIPYLFRGWTCGMVITHQIRGAVADYMANLVKTKAYYLRKLEKKVAEGELNILVDHSVAAVLELWRETAGYKNFKANLPVLESLFRDPAEGFWTCLRIQDAQARDLGGMVLVHDSHTAYNIVNAVRRDLEGDLKRTNVLLMDAGIRHCLQAGLVFDFEGSMLPGVEDFYRTMGGRQTPTYRMQRSRSLVMHLLRSGQILRRERSGGRT